MNPIDDSDKAIDRSGVGEEPLRDGDSLPIVESDDSREIPLDDRPKYRLYSPRGVAWATFWGGFLGGGFLMARNYWVLNRRWKAVIVFFVLGSLAIVSPFLVPSNVYRGTILFATILVWAFASLLQGKLCRNHVRARGELASGVAAFGYGLLGAFLTFIMVFRLDVWLVGSFGTRIRIGLNDEVYYSGGTTAEEARRLGDFLRADGSFDETQPQSVVLSKSGSTFLISFFYDANAWKDPETIKSLEDYSVTLSAEVFEQQPVQVLIRDENNFVRRRLNPRTGVSDKVWQQHFEAGNQAGDEGRHHESEVAFRAAMKEAERHDSLRLQLVLSLNNLGNSRLMQGFTDDVEPHFQRAMSLAEATIGKASYEGSYALEGLGRWERQRKNLSEAEAYFRRALEMRQHVQDERKPDQLEIRENLIDNLISQELFASALELQQQQVAFVEKQTPKDSLQLAANWRLLGWLKSRTGDYQQSRRHLENALEELERSENANTGEYLSCLRQSGFVNHVLGEYEAAERVFRRALELLDRSTSFSPLLRAEFQESLARLLADQAKYEEATQLQRQVLEVQRSQLGQDHVKVADSLALLGSIALQVGHFEEAGLHLQKAIDLFEKSELQDRSPFAESLHDLAQLRHDQGRYWEAERLYRKALAIREEIFGPDHDQVAVTISALSELYCDRDDYEEAEPLALRAHEIVEKRLGAEHPFLVRTLLGLALVQIEQRKLDVAEQTLRQAFQIGQKSLGSQHPDWAELQNTLAVVLLRQERLAEAEPYLIQVLQGYEAVFGRVHPQLVGPLNNLGYLYEQSGRDAAAAEHLERALKMAEGLLGEEHPYLLPILENYAKVLRKLNRPDEAKECKRRMEQIRAKQNPDSSPSENLFIV